MHMEKLCGCKTDNQSNYTAGNKIQDHIARPGEAVRNPQRTSCAKDNGSPGDHGPTATAEIGSKAKRDNKHTPVHDHTAKEMLHEEIRQQGAHNKQKNEKPHKKPTRSPRPAHHVFRRTVWLCLCYFHLSASWQSL